MKKWIKEEDNRLKRLYKTGKTLGEISEITKRTPASISTRLSKLKVKRRFCFQKKNPTKMTSALARIHARICGDGSLHTYQEKDTYSYWGKYRKKPYRTRYMISYTNNNPNLLKEFQQDLEEVFGVSGKKSKSHSDKINEIRISSRRIWDFLKELGAGSSHNWHIPKKIINGSKEIKINWIRAFFDDEAYFEKNNRIRVKIVNRRGLVQIMNILKEFIPCYIMPKTGSYWGNTYCLNILKENVPKYMKIVGSLRANY